MSESDVTTQNDSGKRSFRLWLKRLGVAGFLFFLIKGLLWLIVPFLIGYALW